jgi:hypothetical protein
MRERILRRPLRLHVALVSTLILTMACATTARAEDDEGDPLDVKIFRGVMKELGLQRDEGPIEYRERSPLVVPPSRALPPPRNENQAINANPAWPKDPDAAKRRQEATVTPSQKARLSGDRVIDNLRVLPPDQIATGRTATRPDAGPTNSAEENLRPMTPAELGHKKGLWDTMFSGFGPEKPEYAPFQGEPPRTALTAPPSGYQTPSAAQPYGVTPKRDTPKAATLEDRQPAAPK